MGLGKRTNQVGQHPHVGQLKARNMDREHFNNYIPGSGNSLSAAARTQGRAKADLLMFELMRCPGFT